MIEGLKVILYLIASVIMGGIIILEPDVAGTVSVFYVGILSSFLGLDIWQMIQSTSMMPAGEYKDMKIGRYILCALSYAVLIVIGYWKKAVTGVDLTQMYSVFISAVFILITLLIGGLEGNKIATSKDGTK